MHSQCSGAELLSQAAHRRSAPAAVPAGFGGGVSHHLHTSRDAFTARILLPARPQWEHSPGEPLPALPSTKPKGSSRDGASPALGSALRSRDGCSPHLPCRDHTTQPLSYVSEPHAMLCFHIDLAEELVYAKQTLFGY